MNLESHNRSQRNGYLTVQVVKNSQMKDCGFNECLTKLTNDLNELIDNGFQLPNGEMAMVRLAQYRMDNLEKSKVLRINENFSTSKYFSSYSYITTEARKSARKIENVLPSKFEKRTRASYNVYLR